MSKIALSLPRNAKTGNGTSASTDNFDDLVISVARDIFAEALGPNVAYVLLHNFITRDPSLLDNNLDRIAIFQHLLRESFGDFHTKILEIIVENVCIVAGVDLGNIGTKSMSEIFKETEAAYRLKHLHKTAEGA